MTLTLTLHQHFRTLAHYNVWANVRLYDACAKLSEEAYKKRRAAFFGGIHGVLNHILVGDRIWLARLQGYDAGIERLDVELYDEFAGLREARESEDITISDYVRRLSEDDLVRPIGYRTLDGDPHADGQHALLTHIFNHQTHHRGQAHDLLSQTAVPPPSLDFIVFLRATR